jgi:endonuclease/exonuclease/phosphatase family metal-dependent hydrolase
MITPTSEPTHPILQCRRWFAGILALALCLTACDKPSRTPDWDTPGGESPTAENVPAAQPSEDVLATIRPAAPEAAAEKSVVRNMPAADSGFRFMAYNVRNWLVMDRYVDNVLQRSKPKPDGEKAAVIRMITAHSPDVIGLCEIGTAGDLEEIREMLKSAGLDLPHSHYTGGTDKVRHLGLLSRFPITATSRPAENEFRLHGQTFGINRSILDATLQIRGKPYRFLGVHLKSKRPIEEADQEQLRVNEARLLRRHVDAILGEDPVARLVVYVDFNDTRPTRTFKTATGNYNDPGYLTAVPVKDSRGHAWTHHWAPHDIYSRIDFVTVTRELRREVDFPASYIIDDAGWEQASDHRPLLVIFR